MRSLLSVVAALMVVMATVPYILDILRGKSKPNIVSWLTWTLLTGIGTAAAFASHEPRAALLTLGDFICTLTVVLLGVHYGTAKMSLFDAVCQALAIVGLLLWLIFNSPIIAIFAAVGVDLIVSLPTFRHGWLNPSEETWQTYFIAGAASGLTLLSLSRFTLAGVTFPLFLFISQMVLTAIIIYRRKHLGIALNR